LTTQIWEYYDYTRDKEWLEEVGYDIIKSSANFVSDLLYYANGSYTSAPSYSPEHGSCDLGATYANAVTREVLIEAIKSAEILGKDADLVAEWKEKLNNMYPYQIGRYGQLQEWYKDIDTYGDQHRHTNHLFGLHPGSTVNPITTPELAEACKETLRQRGDAATGWSMGWKLNHWARLQDGDHAYTLFKNLLKEGTLDNMWDTHPPFQIDGNFGGTAGISELFLQSQMDTLYVLPALPSTWKEGSITGLLARGNFTVDIYYANNALDYALVTSNMGEECRIRYAGKTMSFPTVKGEQYKITLENGQLKSEVTGLRPAISESVKEGNVKVFPNPNEGTFTVQVNGAARGEINLVVFSTLGQQIENIKINKESDSIDVPFNCNVNKGNYIVKVEGKGISETQKFIVK
jgi:alpha-L-fucosidase 2